MLCVRSVNAYFRDHAADFAYVAARHGSRIGKAVDESGKGTGSKWQTWPTQGPAGKTRKLVRGRMGAAFGKKARNMDRVEKFFNLGALPAAAVVYLIASTDAMAQRRANCGPREVEVDRLAEGDGETRQSLGLGANNQMIEVFASEETGTWTIMVTAPDGLTCLVASGRAYEEVTEALPANGNEI